MAGSRAIQRTDELLLLLTSAGVEFVVIGGVAAVAHGSATVTFDFDVVAPFSVENLSRLLRALASHDPRFALAGDRRRVTESAEELVRYKNLYLDTGLGRLDVLSEVPPVGNFARITRDAIELEWGGVRCRVISLNDLIAAKAHLGRPKDKQVEHELRALRDRINSDS